MALGGLGHDGADGLGLPENVSVLFPSNAIDLYRASTLGERRPIDDRGRMEQMLRNANLVITAWDEDLLVGISRSLTDFSYATYLADLAVRQSHQRQGIGKELMRRTQQASAPATTVLLAAAAAGADYPH